MLIDTEPERAPNEHLAPSHSSKRTGRLHLSHARLIRAKLGHGTPQGQPLQTGVEHRPCRPLEADLCMPLRDELGPVGAELTLQVVVVIGAELRRASERRQEARILAAEGGQDAADTRTGVAWGTVTRVVEGLQPMGSAVGQNLGAATLQQGPDEWWPCCCERYSSGPFGPGYQGTHTT